MAIIRHVNGQDEVHNGAGRQVIGAHAPNENGLSPKELLEAALGLCISISMQKMLNFDNVKYDKEAIQVEVTSTKPENKRDNRFSSFEVRVAYPPGLDEDYKAKLRDVVERACTISNTLRAEATVELVELPAQGQ
ncbi:OsmC family protein [Cohnella sp. AR92]|uniref:OsmC family protein n=1 Tax=Cohnella sp. AR92 TaxID=648716 RepID=UPI000F8D44B7|nr:OsmC family protein [Cohnella sp. AR92]RUS46592.1 OsmC family peroxiredoxin [Cohnella sp. AR92]